MTTTIATSPVLYTSDADVAEGSALVTAEQAEEFVRQRDFASIYAQAGFVPASVAKVALTEQLVNAGLDFPIEVSPVFHNFGGDMRKVLASTKTGRTSSFNVVRNGLSGEVFNISRGVYQPIPWSSAEVLAPLVDAGLATWDGVLKLRGGAVGVVRAKLADSIVLPGDTSQTNLYLSVVIPHDLTMTWHLYLSTVRAICENTLAMGLFQAKKRRTDLKVRHTATGEAKVKQAEQILVNATETFRNFQSYSAKLAAHQISDSRFSEFVEDMLPANGDKVTPQLVSKRETVASIYQGRTVTGLRGTALGAVNAWTEAVQHYSHAKTPDARMDSILFGSAANKSQDAYTYWTEEVGELV